MTRVANQNNLQDFGYSYDIFANLAARKDNLRNLEETFTYDNLNRLETTTLNGGQANRMAYDPYGRILSKQADGQLVFDNPAYDDGNKPHAIRSAQMYGNPFPTTQQDITYTMFDKVATISQSGNGPQMSLSYTYGHDRQRKRMVEKIGNYTLREKRYGDHCEFVTENRYSTSRTFLLGPLGVFAVVEHNGDSDEIHYVYKDNLGSWTTITDAGGFVEREQSFDAWGNLRNPETWSGDYNNTLMFDRGYTGHEHLYSFGLINMNGRCYDPVTSSFLSVDAYVQSPDNSQSFNRYSYCQNNPLRYTDPTGWQLVGGTRPRPQGFYDKWGDYYSRPAYEPRDFRNPYHLWNLAMYGNFYGPGFASSGADGASASGGAVSIADFQGTYGYHAAYQANSVYNYTFPSAKLQLIRNWQYSPSYRTNSDIRDAGITGLTVGVANYGNGYQKSYYTYTASGKTYSIEALDYVGRSMMGCYSMTNQSLDKYGNSDEGVARVSRSHFLNTNTGNRSSAMESLMNVGQAGGGVATAVDGAASRATMKTLSLTSKAIGGVFVVASEIPDLLVAWDDPSLGNVTKVVVGFGLGAATIFGGPFVATGAFVLGVVNAYGGFEKGYDYLNNLGTNNR